MSRFSDSPLSREDILTRENAGLQKELEVVRTALAAMRDTCAADRKELEAARKENEAFEVRVASLEGDLTIFQHRVEAAEEELTRFKSRFGTSFDAICSTLEA